MGLEGILGHIPSWWLTVTAYSWLHFRLGMRQLVLIELQLRSPSSSSIILAVYELTWGWPRHEIRASLAAQSREATTSSGGHGAEMKQRGSSTAETLDYQTLDTNLNVNVKEAIHFPLFTQIVRNKKKVPVSMVTVSLSELLHMKLDAITYAV